jgi:hypothetical protein
MPALTIRITEDARSALQDLAQAECRSPRDQAAFLVIEGLRAARLTGRHRQDHSGDRRTTDKPERRP